MAEYESQWICGCKVIQYEGVGGSPKYLFMFGIPELRSSNYFDVDC